MWDWYSEWYVELRKIDVRTECQVDIFDPYDNLPIMNFGSLGIQKKK